MSDDLLGEATRAVREATEDSGDGGAFTRMRIMHSLHGVRRRRLTRVLVWAPLTAVLAGATAAAATGQAARVWLAIERVVISAPPGTDAQKPSPAAQKAQSRVRAPSLDQAPAPEPTPSEDTAVSDTPEPGVVAPEPEHVPADDEVIPRPARNPVPAATRGRSAEDLAAARELELYRAAHRVHFQKHDCPSAVVAWERYLAEAPRGRFTLEARYNRALCLVRLGREREAAAALRPFARGSFGGYRQSDARALLDALESKDSGTD
jgi:hypothetical protein